MVDTIYQQLLVDCNRLSEKFIIINGFLSLSRLSRLKVSLIVSSVREFYDENFNEAKKEFNQFERINGIYSRLKDRRLF